MRNYKEWETLMGINYYTDRKPQIIEFEQEIIIPTRKLSDIEGKYYGGVCDSELNYVSGFLRCGLDNKKICVG